MKINLALSCFVIVVFSCSCKDGLLREKININREWKYKQGDHKGAEAYEFNDQDWDRANIPHSFSLPYFQTGFWYSGYGWYRKYFEIPGKWNGKQIFVEFEGAFRDAEIFVNGKLAGTHQSGYTGFSLDITDLVRAGKNVLAVRLNNLWNSQLAPRGGDHIFPGGIYRDVYLVATNPAYVTWYGTFVTTPEASAEAALVNVKTEVRNGSGKDKTYKLKTTLIGPDNRKVGSFSSSLMVLAGQTVTFNQTGKPIKNAKLWHPDHPYLYKAVSELYEGHKKVDCYETTFGIRWMEWTADKGFFLNGEHYYFKGANVHQDHAGWANAVTNAGFVRDVQMVKDAGMDFIRGSHYPHDPAFSYACDSLGVLLLQENNFWSCGIRGDGGWYTGDGAYPPLEEDQLPFEENVKTSLEEMIRIHRNHPSVIAWSMCNELFFTNGATLSRVREFLKELVQLSHNLDPSRKAVAGGVQRGDLDKTGDIAAYNGDGARLFIDPGIPSFVSEYGSTIEDRPGTYGPGWGHLQQQPFIWRSGQLLWCAFDYGTHIGNGRFGHMGMIDYYRLPKRMWYWYRNEYRHMPPPEWPQEGAPAKLQLTTDKTVIGNTDGTDDVHIVVAVLDKQSKAVSNCPDVTLWVESGPGEFPTGKSITFSTNSDISIRDGKAAIEFRSYYAGKSVIRATSPGLAGDTIHIKTDGTHQFVEGEFFETVDRTYLTYEIQKLKSNNELNLAYQKPTRVSSELTGHSAKNGNDQDYTTYWQVGHDDGEPWFQVDLEALVSVKKVNVYFPVEGNYRFFISASGNGNEWKELVDQKNNRLAYKMQEFNLDEGINSRFLRFTFTGSAQKERIKLSEIEVFGNE